MFAEKNLQEFVDVLSSSAPVPGGGGAAAYTAALGMSLGSMVANLTTGKKKYAAYQAEIDSILERAAEITAELISCMDKDAEAFEPLSRAYGLPKSTEEELETRNKIMEAALLEATLAPLHLMEVIMSSMEVLDRLAVIGSRLAISDVGVGIQFAVAALNSASLNVFINTKLMKNRECADELNAKTYAMLEEGRAKSARIYDVVEKAIKPVREAKVLKGLPVAKAINAELTAEAATLEGATPHLAIVRIGERPDDLSYERGALKKMDTVGFRTTVFAFPADISNDEFQAEFDKINENPDIDGILLFRPLPKHIDGKAIEQRIDPRKDLDGISPINLAKVFAGDETGHAPCTAEAVVEMLDHSGIDITGKRVTVVGRSLVIGKPVSMLLMKKNATVTICHTRTKDMKATCKNAEIIVAAAGVAKMLTADYIADGATVIDVGINVDAEGNLCGDVNFDEASKVAGIVTPVPGGVGSVTTSVLAKHLLKAAKQR